MRDKPMGFCLLTSIRDRSVNRKLLHIFISVLFLTKDSSKKIPPKLPKMNLLVFFFKIPKMTLLDFFSKYLKWPYQLFFQNTKNEFQLFFKIPKKELNRFFQNTKNELFLSDPPFNVLDFDWEKMMKTFFLSKKKKRIFTGN